MRKTLIEMIIVSKTKIILRRKKITKSLSIRSFQSSARCKNLCTNRILDVESLEIPRFVQDFESQMIKQYSQGSNTARTLIEPALAARILPRNLVEHKTDIPPGTRISKFARVNSSFRC